MNIQPSSPRRQRAQTNSFHLAGWSWRERERCCQLIGRSFDMRSRRAPSILYKTLGPILEDHNVLVCPTLALPSVKADHDELNPDFRINGKPVHAYVGWVMTNPFNLVSQCAAMSVPSGFADT